MGYYSWWVLVFCFEGVLVGKKAVFGFPVEVKRRVKKVEKVVLPATSELIKAREARHRREARKRALKKAKANDVSFKAEMVRLKARLDSISGGRPLKDEVLESERIIVWQRQRRAILLMMAECRIRYNKP